VIEPLRIVFDVAAEPAHAFWIWTQRASMWWPPSHTAAKRRGTRLVFEPRLGGRVFERDPDGNEVDWGTALEWQPPGRLVYRWHIFSDVSDATEVEVRFAANGDGTTRVELEHRGWDTFGDGAARRERNHSGWRPLIGRYVRACRRTAEATRVTLPGRSGHRQEQVR
jgi:uncharacterized protein YndB with AHSA1/START domain